MTDQDVIDAYRRFAPTVTGIVATDLDPTIRYELRRVEGLRAEVKRREYEVEFQES